MASGQGRGRPRQPCTDEKQQHEQELKHQEYLRKKEREKSGLKGKGGRPRKESGTEEELEELIKKKDRKTTRPDTRLP